MQANGKIEIASALIRQRQQHARQRQVEETGHDLFHFNKTAQHRRQQRKTRGPMDLGGRRWPAEKMDESVNSAADHHRGGPAKRFPQRAENRATKQDFLQHRHHRRRQRCAGNFFDPTAGGNVDVHLARPGHQDDHSDAAQRRKAKGESAGKFASLVRRFDQSDVTAGRNADAAEQRPESDQGQPKQCAVDIAVKRMVRQFLELRQMSCQRLNAPGQPRSQQRASQEHNSGVNQQRANRTHGPTIGFAPGVAKRIILWKGQKVVAWEGLPC